MSNSSLSNSMPCPICKTNIPFDPIGLIKGAQFACPGCQAQIGISGQEVPRAEEALEKLEEIKKQKS
ncbi:MAG: hypothetical protein KDC34_20740 [Saprospiraceae bacterium]|nr:hypothetical protein [Saprospiraceae bacterium]